MDRNGRILVIALGAIVIVVAVATGSLALTLLALAALIAVAVVTRRSGVRAKAARGPEPSAPAAKDPEWVEPLRALVAVDIAVREHDLPASVVETVERNVDVLRELVPDLNDRHAGSELAWTVNRMATDYIPRLVGPYTGLGADQRAARETEFRESLSGLEAELVNIRELVERADEGDFQAKAAFLRARFLEGA